MSGTQLVTINSRKFDNQIHRTWQADLIESKNSLLIFRGVFESEVKHSNLGVIRRGTISDEFYWLDRWYNIFLFQEPDGSLRNFYCNINLPPRFENGVLDYVDLDVDVLIWPDFKYEILDLQEFAENAKKYKYPEDLKQNVDSNVKELIRMIETREYPFNLKN